MIERLMKILDNLIGGKIIIDDSDRGRIAYEVERLLTQTTHSEADVTTMNLIIQISNILYNNTDMSVLLMEDGVYDMFLECYKKYDADYQIGARPIEFAPTGEPVQNKKDKFPVIYMDRDYVDSSLYIEDPLAFGSPPFDMRMYGKTVDTSALNNISKRNVNVPHGYPKLVGTLDKCKFVLNAQAKERGVFDDANVQIFERDFLGAHLQRGLFGPNDIITLVLELKYDGISVEADVTDIIESGRSRGDANNDIAADLTPILQGYKFLYAPKIPKEEMFGMKFEAIVTYSNLEALSKLRGKPYVNARNAIIGLFGASDAAQYRDFITLVPLATSLNMDALTEIEFMNKYYHSGIYLNHVVATGTYNQVLYQVYKFVQEAEYMRPFMPFMYDGVVASYVDENIKSILGRENSVNKYSIAIKFNPLKRSAIFTGYSYTVGQNGMITPMIHYTPVEFYGGIHTKSSGHSYARFMDLGLKIGDIVDLEYTHDVMPYVTRPNNSHNEQNQQPVVPFISECLSCGQPITISDSGKSAFCTNINCHERQITRLTNMFKKLNIKDFSEMSLLAINASTLKEIVAITPQEAIAALGEANGAKFIERIQELMTTPIYDYRIVGSIGFSDVAVEKWKKILNYIPLYAFVEPIYHEQHPNDLYDMLVSIKGIGPNTARTIVDECKVFYDDLIFISHMKNVIQSYGEKAQKSIRFTGVRDSALEQQLRLMGYDANGQASVTKTTDIIIVPDPGYTSAKTAKAGPDAIIVDIEEFKANMPKYL